jgi:hypothetical protein
LITWACVKGGIAETSSIVRARPSIHDREQCRMVMSIPDPGGFAKTFVTCQNFDALYVLGKEAIIHRLLKKFVQQGRSE